MIELTVAPTRFSSYRLSIIAGSTLSTVLSILTIRPQTGVVVSDKNEVVDGANLLQFGVFGFGSLEDWDVRPRWTSENRPMMDTSKPANGGTRQEYLYTADRD